MFNELPRRRAGLIMADPPWSFRHFSHKGVKKSAQAHYRCLDLEEVSALPVADLAASDCLLWLWATHPMLPQALAVMAAWGFDFRTSGVWVKRTRGGKLAFGTGYILRSASEPFLIGVRGKPRCARTVRTVVIGDLREHSRKPDEAYAAAEELVIDPGVRIDLFSRESRPGWLAWGDEAGKFDIESEERAGAS